MAANDVSLMVLPGQGENSFRFLIYRKGVWRDIPPHYGVQPGKQETIRAEVDKHLNDLMTQVNNKLAANEPVPSFLAPLRDFWKRVYRAVIPLDGQNVLKEVAQGGNGNDIPTLRLYLHSQYEWIPWEIMHDGTEFLGLRFRIARLPVVPRGPDPADDHSHPVRRISSLLGANVLSPNDTEQWKGTFADLPASVNQVRWPSEAEPEAWPVYEQMVSAVQEADIFHITCHGGFRDDDGVFWSLDHKSTTPSLHTIRTSAVEGFDLANSQPLVFGNACASVGAANSQQGRDPMAADIARAFFDQGATAFVGTFAPVTQRIAVDFARQFYQHLLVQGLPIGTAMWATKKHYMDNQVSDPSWLFYCLYGLPETSFQIVP
jgi:CHAT domain-containing protein